MKTLASRLVLGIGTVALLATSAHADPPFYIQFSPEGCLGCVRGKIYENVRGPLATEEPGQTEYSQGQSLEGRIPTTESMFYRDQPASQQTYTTVASFGAETIYMTRQFHPTDRNAWIRVDFGALVSIQPPTDNAAGLAYALYVKEDGGDGVITNAGMTLCGGDDTCGYLQQTYNAPWLLNCDRQRVWASPMTSNFFQVSGTPLVEVQVHLWPLHQGITAGSVTLNNGFIGISSGKP